MDRRDFLAKLSTLPLAALGIGAVAQWGAEAAFGCDSTNEGIKTFAYYQGLRPTERRSASRTDGTFSSMPCIKVSDIEAGVQKTYKFWHGHGSKTHQFTITEENFSSLQKGEVIEIYTDVVEGHRHALKVMPQNTCTFSAK